MAASISTDGNLLFGLLALQNGLIDQDQLFAAFRTWSRDRIRTLADHLVARGDLDTDDRDAVGALVIRHLKRHGGDAEKSLAAIPVGDLTRASLAQIGDPQVEATLGRVGAPALTSDEGSTDHTASYSVGSATSDGQRFRILRPHAKGGLGAVFVALDVELNREVALKQILDSHADDPASRARFVVEAEITGGLEHPGIVPVYGLGSFANGRPYYATRFVRGESLKEAIEYFHVDESLEKDASRRSLELHKLLRRFADVCNAIEYAHSRGVLHRDIKPSNVILGKHGETLLVDWGLAKATGKSDPSSGERTLRPSSTSGSSETLPGSALGTPAYMSPEQAEGDLERLGPRSDVYSLGATLYCLLTGKAPFVGDAADVLHAVQKGEFRRPRAVDPAIDSALEAVCLKAMALKPADRYPTPKALAEDIDRWMADVPVSAWREPLTRRGRRWSRRNRTAVATAAAALLFALASTAAVLAVQTKANVELEARNLDLAAANRKVTQANKDLEAANQREHERFDLATDAIKLFHGEISEDLMLKERQFATLRTKLLRGAADFYAKLEALLTDQTDSKSRVALGKAYDELGKLTANIGNMPAALAVHRKALAVRRDLAARQGARTEAILDVARSLLAAGFLQTQTGDQAGAMASYEEARSLAESLDKTGSATAEVRAVLGTTQRSIGSLLWETGKPIEALATYESSRAVLQELADANPSTIQVQRDLAAIYLSMGELLWQTNNPRKALAAYESARTIQEKLADANPSVTALQNELARTYTSIGLSLSGTGNVAGALAACERARTIFQKLTDANPSANGLQTNLAWIHLNIGFVLSKSKPTEALAALDRARSINQKLADDNPTVIEHQTGLATAVLGIGTLRQAQGKTAEAAGAYRDAIAILERLPVLTPLDRYNVGCAHARLAGVAALSGSDLSPAEERAEADRAMNWLRAAVAAGFRSLAVLNTDTDLDPLRSRADFQILMMDVAMPDWPFSGGR
jgi:serine/threonine protein kinase/tetratricopeptide (TPR) repeat protein